MTETESLHEKLSLSNLWLMLIYFLSAEEHIWIDVFPIIVICAQP
jgi:hypothetical protein